MTYFILITAFKATYPRRILKYFLLITAGSRQQTSRQARVLDKAQAEISRLGSPQDEAGYTQPRDYSGGIPCQ
jgi:hypothetical protein